MINSLEKFQNSLAGSSLGNSVSVEVPILDTNEVAFVLEIEVANIEKMWRAARSLLDATGRWPIVSTFWSGKGKTLADEIQDEDFFSRFYYEEVDGADDVSPRALIEASKSVDVQKFLETMEKANEEEDDFEDYIEYELESTNQYCNNSPSREDIDKAKQETASINSISQLDRWLLDWELANGCTIDPVENRLDWFVPERALIIFLPTPSAWETLAYLNWYGTYHGTEKYIALGKTWEERFGAELVAHYGTMLQCIVSRPPQDIHTAWSLAKEHNLVGPCALALPGISTRHYAVGLVGHDRWFLHERP